jgi:hypothetical protein
LHTVPDMKYYDVLRNGWNFTPWVMSSIPIQNFEKGTFLLVFVWEYMYSVYVFMYLFIQIRKDCAPAEKILINRLTVMMMMYIFTKKGI